MTSHPFPLLWKFKSVCAWNHFFLLFFHFRIFEILLYTSKKWKGGLAEFCLMRKSAKSFVINTFRSTQQWSLIAELAERSPIIIQNGSSNPSSRKNLDSWPYDRTTVRPYDRTTVRPYKVLLLTCVVNCTAGTPTPRLCPVQWSVHWAPSWTTRVLVLAGARRCALEMCGKKICELRS